MKLVAVTMVKDELDILPYTLHMMTHEVDAIIVSDNGSTDGTREMLTAFQQQSPVPVVILYDSEVGYYQSAKMTALARLAHDAFDADWIIPFDADEVWTGGSKPIRQILGTHNDWWVIKARLYDHVATGEDNQYELNPVRRMEWRRPSPAPLPKVAVRWHDSLVIEMGNHGATYDFELEKNTPLLEVHHFPMRSAAQVLSKTINGGRAYEATDLPEHQGAHWRQWYKAVQHNGEDWIADMFYTYYFRQVPTEPIKIDGERQSPLYRNPIWRD